MGFEGLPGVGGVGQTWICRSGEGRLSGGRERLGVSDIEGLIQKGVPCQ